MTLARHSIKTHRRSPPKAKKKKNSLSKQHRRLLSHILLIGVFVSAVFVGTREAFEHRLIIGSAIAEILNLLLLIFTGTSEE